MSRKEEIRSFVGKKIRSLQTGAATAGTKATLADLRRGVGREPGEMPQLFGTILKCRTESPAETEDAYHSSGYERIVPPFTGNRTVAEEQGYPSEL